MGNRVGRLTKTYSITDARRYLAELVRDVEGGNRAVLTGRGKPVAVLLGLSEFGHPASERPTFDEVYGAFRARADLDALQIDPDEVFGGARDSAPGRTVEL